MYFYGHLSVWECSVQARDRSIVTCYWPISGKRNRDTAVSAEGNGDLQTLICVLVARPKRCLTLSNPVP